MTSFGVGGEEWDDSELVKSYEIAVKKWRKSKGSGSEEPSPSGNIGPWVSVKKEDNKNNLLDVGRTSFSTGRPQPAVEEEDCGSFIVVQRWSNEDEAPRTPPTPADEEELLMMSEEGEGDSQSKDMENENEEQFCDAAATLGSSETLTMTNVSMTEKEGTGTGENPSTVSVGVVVNMAMSQDDERFSMTNYSTASSTSEYQVEEQEARLNKIIADHKSLLELLEKQNLELEQRKMAIEELKLLANESVSREKEKSEESRKIVENAIAERDLAVQKLEALKAEAEAAAQAASTHEFETLEPIERQLQQRDEIIQRNNEQIKELSTRLHAEILKVEELAKILQSKEEEDRKKNDSLSSSDEALARAMSAKEGLEEALEASFKEKAALQSSINALRDELQSFKDHQEQAQSELQRASLKCCAVDAEINDMRVKLAALQAEKERQEQSFHSEMERVEETRRENETLKNELESHKKMLQEKMVEIERIRASNTNPANNSGMAGSMFGNNFLGGLFKSTSGGNLQQQSRGFGIRDADDDPNEPFVDPTDNAAGAQNNASLEHLPLNSGSQQECFQCPICLKRFDRLRKLEFHASECGIEAATRTDPFVFP